MSRLANGQKDENGMSQERKRTRAEVLSNLRDTPFLVKLRDTTILGSPQPPVFVKTPHPQANSDYQHG